MERLIILFYHPKDPKNLEDIAAMAERLGGETLAIPRPGGPRVEETRARIVSLEEARRLVEGCHRILLETYGLTYLDEAEIDCGAQCITLILGAEDYGVPRHVAEALEPHTIARIPMAVEGMSYNVASTAAMALYEIVSRCGRPKNTTRHD